ncbi:MAG: IS630 family transposase [Myxococcota bacterium]
MIAAWVGCRVRLWCQDESRFGLLPRPTRRVTSFGVKSLVHVAQKYEWLWLYGAVEIGTGCSFMAEFEGLNTDCFQAYLDEFAKAFPSEHHVFILDGAQAHRTKRLIWPENVTPLFLPPYCPELNPIERLWQAFKKAVDPSTADIEHLRSQTDRLVTDLDQHELASLVSYPYLLEALESF